MRSFIVGTAGHVDHGKTALVQALTGVDTDRLKEEKRRGISIELGYAPLALSEECIAGIVDVPGHERLVKTMVMGAAQMDLVLFIVAANEGMKPQSREHLSILSLLGVQHGIVVLTKTDKADSAQKAAVAADIKKACQGTFLENAPLVQTSAVTRGGLEELKGMIQAFSERFTKEQDQRQGHLLRMSIDRVFTLPGHGTVVTGPLLSGSCSEGDELLIYPQQKRVRIRQIQAYGRRVAQINAPSRVAFNIKGMEKGDLHKGQVLGRDLYATASFSARIHFVEGSSRGEFNFHLGTMRTLATLRRSNGLSVYRVTLSEPVVMLPGDRFILRRQTTVAGGEVLLTRFVRQPKITEPQKKPMNCTDPYPWAERLHAYIAKSAVGWAPVPLDKIKEEAGLLIPQIQPALRLLVQEKRIVSMPKGFYLSDAQFEKVRGQVKLFFETHSEMNVRDVKNLFSVSRKAAIPYLEFFDIAKWTMRRGDIRMKWQI